MATRLRNGSDAAREGLEASLRHLVGFDRVVLSIGTSEFRAALLDSLKQTAGVDHCMVIAFAPKRRPEYLLTDGTIEPRSAIDLAEAYVGRFHDLDPNKETIFRNDASPEALLLPFIRTGTYRRDYRKKFFTDSGICDKFATAFWRGGACFYSNFYRLNRTGHFAEAQPGSADAPRDLGYALDCFFERTPPFSLLTKRERAVCVSIILGFTSEAIALNLGIGLNTVLTYRKRAYARLKITSQNELFTLVINHSDSTFGSTRRLSRNNSIASHTVLMKVD
jgi:DNA-binding CsgD family transcriptional regulator